MPGGRPLGRPDRRTLSGAVARALDRPNLAPEPIQREAVDRLGVVFGLLFLFGILRRAHLLRTRALRYAHGRYALP